MTGAIAIALIAAVADNGVIGAAGGMPWRLATDMKRFRALTMGKPVIMGRKTFAAIGKPLAGRVNVVVTRERRFLGEGVIVAPDLGEGIAAARAAAGRSGAGEVMVIGGGEIYAAALPLADRLYITEVHARPDGDTRFPAVDLGIWRAVASEAVPAGEKDSAATTFVTYERIPGREGG